VRAFRSTSPSLVAAATLVAVTAGLGVGLGAMAWTNPPREVVAAETSHTRQVDFSYTATVRQSAAYDGTQVSSPDPIFRKVADFVAVHLAYTGAPGTMSVTAELSAPSGWHSSMLLSPTSPVTGGGRNARSVMLNLAPLEARAAAGAAATGIPADELDVTIRAKVNNATGAPFVPEMRLRLTPQELALADDPAALKVADSTTTTRQVSQPVKLLIGGWSISVIAARFMSALILLACALGAPVFVFLSRREHHLDEATLIRRRYSSLLVVVEPVSATAGRPLVDVPEIATLVKLAERYGLLILSWTRSGVETFIVQDENTTYRFRTGTAASAVVLPVVALA
jgi:hypothetical protein